MLKTVPFLSPSSAAMFYGSLQAQNPAEIFRIMEQFYELAPVDHSDIHGLHCST